MTRNEILIEFTEDFHLNLRENHVKGNGNKESVSLNFKRSKFTNPSKPVLNLKILKKMKQFFW